MDARDKSLLAGFPFARLLPVIDANWRVVLPSPPKVPVWLSESEHETVFNALLTLDPADFDPANFRFGGASPILDFFVSRVDAERPAVLPSPRNFSSMELAAGSERNTALDALTGADSIEFDRHLEVLLASVTGPVRGAISRALGSHFHTQTGSVPENVDDLTSETILLLVRKLRELHGDASAGVIENFTAYAVKAASNVCHAYLRRRYPAWTRLKNQVRYVATHDPYLALRLENGVSTCELKEANARLWGVTGGKEISLRDQVQMVIRQSSGSVELNQLVRSIAGMRGISDGGPAAAAADDVGDTADPRPIAGLDDVSLLSRVWQEIQELPVRQRTALLLNLRDQSGHSMLRLFPITGAASIRQIADAVDIPAEELAKMWNHLPMEDLQIAGRLGITRQQVINLRKAARARLARRMVI